MREVKLGSFWKDQRGFGGHAGDKKAPWSLSARVRGGLPSLPGPRASWGRHEGVAFVAFLVLEGGPPVREEFIADLFPRTCCLGTEKGSCKKAFFFFFCNY